MTWAFGSIAAPAVQNGATATATLTGVPAGALLVLGVKVSSENQTILSVVDDRGNTYAVGPNSSLVPNAGGPNTISLYRAQNAAAGDTTVTVTFLTGSASDIYLQYAYYTGLRTSGAFDQDGSNNLGTVPNLTATTGAIVDAVELVIAFGLSRSGASRPLTAPTGLTFTQRSYLATPALGFWDASSSVSGAQAINLACTGGDSDLSLIVNTYREPGAPAGPANSGRAAILGVGG